MKLMGGLGNQMFQYALGKKLSIQHNTKLCLDISSFDSDKLRIYDLDIFKNIHEETIYSQSGLIIRESQFKFSPSILGISDGYLDGYWQTYKYFDDIKNIIKNDFKFKNEILDNSREILNDIKNKNSVLINIRRTDYLTKSNFHNFIGTDYVMKAVEIIESKILEPHYFIFSDDIEWCKENIKLENMTIVDHSHKGYKFDNYLQLMIECKNFIIPNSSFAWWAAWLSNNEDKNVIAPIKWFEVGIDTSDLIPKNWIRI
jgi:hypothetical protein